MKARFTFKFDGTCSGCPFEYDAMGCNASANMLDILNDVDRNQERHPDCPLEIMEED